MEYSPKNNKWVYPDNFNSEDECFESIKDNLVKLYELIKKDNISEFDNVYLPNNLKMKISYLLNHENFLSILDRDDIDRIIGLLDLEELRGFNYLEKNRSLLEFFKNIDEMKNWNTLDISRFCWKPEGLNLVNLRRGKAITTSVEEINNVIAILENKKQIILYGPPGTGKTFKTRQFAIEVLE